MHKELHFVLGSTHGSIHDILLACTETWCLCQPLGIEHVARCLNAHSTCSIFEASVESIQFGFSRISNSTPGCSQDQRMPVPAHIPTLEESGLGPMEYESTVSSVSDHSGPTASNKKQRQQGTYTHY